MLTPLGWLYGRIADLRNALYDRGVLRSYPLGARTISVGNITTGGTGKTPLVAHVAEILAERGAKVCILTRGYGRENPKDRVLVSDGVSLVADTKQSGDEPVELARKLLGKAVIVADADRVSAAKWAKENFGVTAFVLDDAFQHRRAKRDVDIVCIDATNPFGDSKMLPAGSLREPLHNLQRADAVVITRADMLEDISDLKSEISDLNPAARVFTSFNRISGVTELGEFHAKAQSSQGGSQGSIGEIIRRRVGDAVGSEYAEAETRLLAFCALGNPNSFFNLLLGVFDEDSMEEFDLSIMKEFPDHHGYSQTDISALEKKAREGGVQALLTTAKDAVKLAGLNFTLPCYVVQIEMVLDDEEAFRALL